MGSNKKSTSNPKEEYERRHPKCGNCAGTGKVMDVLPGGGFTQKTCGGCGGSGRIP